jgi:hypothetical protein
MQDLRDLKDWRRVRDETLTKWRHLRDLLVRMDPEEFSREVSQTCSFCEKAQAVARSLGKKIKCQFCAAFFAYGGCQPILEKISKASEESDWGTIQREVDGVIAKLESAGEEEFARLEAVLDKILEEEEQGGA